LRKKISAPYPGIERGIDLRARLRKIINPGRPDLEIVTARKVGVELAVRSSTDDTD